MMTLLLFYQTFLFLFAFVSSQAPDDVSMYCIDNSLVPDYLSTVKPLMDSSSYKHLLGQNGVWQSVNLDDHSEKWVVSSNSQPCSNVIQVHEPSNVPQDNWLITQHISKSIPQQSDSHPTYIYVNLTFRIDSSCAICHNSFQLLNYFTNTSMNDIANRTSDFSVVANLTQPGNAFVTVSNQFAISPEQDGFYLALKDYGTNVTVSRFLVYRLIGPSKQVGLTIYPESPAPTLDYTAVSGICAANSNTTTGKKPALNLDPDGTWSNTVQDQCFCIEGHEKVVFNSETNTINQCQACDPGTYKALKDNSECLNCPLNSISTVYGSSICQCENNFYRAATDTADHGCTEPPSAPRNLQTAGVSATSVVLNWDQPERLGGRTDTFYDIFIFFNGSYTKNNMVPVNKTTYQATGLLPNTFYQITVFAENGVSSQAGNGFLRSTTTFVTTSMGVPPMVTGVIIALGGTVVEWYPTSSINGTITKYEVQLFSSEASGVINTVMSTLSYYTVNVTKDFPTSGQPVEVRVRAFTGAGPGDWSEPVVFAQINSIAPTSISSVAPSTFSPVASVGETSTSVMGGASSPILGGASSSVGGVSNVPKSSTTTSTKTKSTTEPHTTSTPTGSSTGEESNPVVAIVAVLGGAVGILFLVGMGALIYYILRKYRLKKFKKQEDIDYAPLVEYTAAAGDGGTGDSEDEIRVELNTAAHLKD